jgi:hypothetical protein
MRTQQRFITTTFVLSGVLALSGCDKPDKGDADKDKDKTAASKKAEDAAGDKAGGDEAVADEAVADEAVADAFVPWCPQCKCEGDPIDPAGGPRQQKCKLTEAMAIQGFKVKPSDLTFDAEGRMITFNVEEDTKIGEVTCGAGYVVGLFGDGKLDYCSTSGEVVIEGVPCNGQLSLRNNGELSRCKLGKAHKFGDIEIPSGSWVSFWEGEGTRLDRFEVPDGAEVDGIKCKGYMNYLHEDGIKLRKCELDGDQKIEGKTVATGTSVCFDTDGKVAECSTFSFRMTG